MTAKDAERHLQFALDQIKKTGDVSLDALKNLYHALELLDPKRKYDPKTPRYERALTPSAN